MQILVYKRACLYTSFNNMQSIDDFVLLLNNVNINVNIKINKEELYQLESCRNCYRKFIIHQINGKERIINRPIEELKKIQNIIQLIFEELYFPPANVHGFIKTRSIITNAKMHVGKKYVYNIDLENFFNSISKQRVYNTLLLSPFNLGNEKIEIASLISNLVTYFSKDNRFPVLPQGAPTSPILSNIICNNLDKKLIGLSEEYALVYTRYADDITFSSNHNIYTNQLFLRSLAGLIESEGFKINVKKTRLQNYKCRQMVTGLVVNEKINVTRKCLEETRMLLHLLEKYGLEKAQTIFKKKNKRYCVNCCILNSVCGKINFIGMVKGYDDETYLTYYNKIKKIKELFRQK